MASFLSSSVPGPKGKVLIVDDDAGIRDLFRALLEGRYHVAEADCGAALEQALEEEQPDVVLLDVALPDANGLNLLPAIKKRWPGTEVILMSGSPNDSCGESWATEAQNRGAFKMMSKSADFNMQDLLGGVGLAVQRRRDNVTPGPDHTSLSTPGV